jgi:xanthine dehydrogenase accessory factor
VNDGGTRAAPDASPHRDEPPFLFPHLLIVILGAGDLASGVAYRLVRAGFPVVMTELPRPTMVRTTVSYGAAVLHGAAIVEGLYARRVEIEQVADTLATGTIPILIDPGGEAARSLNPAVLVDARVAKVNLGLRITDAPLVIGLGPGFTAGRDCHAVVETNRGHHLGRVIQAGSAEPDTGVPAAVNGKEAERVLRAPADGTVRQVKVIGQRVTVGTVLAWVGETPLVAPFDGVLRGLIDDEVVVARGMKIGDLDPRLRREHCFTLSDKTLAVGGGVVEAVVSSPTIRRLIRTPITAPIPVLGTHGAKASHHR